jgi:hypothetical protein
MLTGAVIAIAGYSAEREWGLRPARFSWEADRNRAADLALDFAGGDEREANLLLRIVELRAQRSVRHWQRQIGSVAEALMHEHVLTFEQVRSIIAV